MARSKAPEIPPDFRIEKLKKPMGNARRRFNSVLFGGVSATVGASAGMIAGLEVPYSLATKLPAVVVDAHTIIPSLYLDNASIGATLGAASLFAFGLTFALIGLRNRNSNIAKKNEAIIEHNRVAMQKREAAAVQSVISYYSSDEHKDDTIPTALANLLPKDMNGPGLVKNNQSPQK